jgi:hypothetical protein
MLRMLAAYGVKDRELRHLAFVAGLVFVRIELAWTAPGADFIVDSARPRRCV